MNKKLLYALIGVIALVLSYTVYERYFVVVDEDDVEGFAKKWGWWTCRKYNKRVVGKASSSLTSLRKVTKDNRNKYHPSWGARMDKKIKNGEKRLEKVQKTYNDRC